jgi:hypothetical protein
MGSSARHEMAAHFRLLAASAGVHECRRREGAPDAGANPNEIVSQLALTAPALSRGPARVT